MDDVYEEDCHPRLYLHRFPHVSWLVLFTQLFIFFFVVVPQLHLGMSRTEQMVWMVGNVAAVLISAEGAQKELCGTLFLLLIHLRIAYHRSFLEGRGTMSWGKPRV